MLYSRTVIDHFRKPRNSRAMPDANGEGRAINRACSDVVHFYIRVADGLIADASFKAQGCVACIAASSVTTELCIGRTLDEALAIDKDVIADALDGVPPPKMVCSMICPTALRVAVEDFRAR